MNKVISFQKKIAKNNNREWFQEHKKDYETSNQELRDFTIRLMEEMKKHDTIDEAGTKIFRIYRDVRFSKDKTPYTLHRSFSMKRATDALRGGYYMRIQPGQSFLIGGFFGPEPGDLLHIRKQIQQDPDRLRKILNSKKIKDYFGELVGEEVKTAPKGFSKDDPAIDLLRRKGFMLRHDFTDKEVGSPDFAVKVSEGFKKMRPFLDYMSEILTTDLNGASLLK
jgi:uncharacterized protein (TIGR02453 family)